MWHYSVDGQKGQNELEKLVKWIQKGKLGPDTLVWTDGMADWVRLADSELAQYLPPKPEPPKPAPPHRPSGLFGIFDIGFTRFIANTWVSILWFLTIIITVVYGMLLLAVGLFFGVSNLISSDSAYEKIGAFVIICGVMILVPVLTALQLIGYRLFFELLIVIFRIETHLRTLRDKAVEQNDTSE